MMDEFWIYLQQLVDESSIVIDRPKGSIHPRFDNGPYPADYGYLTGTMASDGGGVDVWVGSLGKKTVVGALCTVDLFKRDTELKIMLDCTGEEVQAILNYTNSGKMRGIYLQRGEASVKEINHGMDT